MNFSITCIVLLSILSISSCAAAPAGGEGASKGGGDGGDKKAKAASFYKPYQKGTHYKSMTLSQTKTSLKKIEAA
ncbi:hypothetical protein PGT21_016278 [Puccinia graminis f. sp. tritici]|uniref:Uncharacterized protein n=1 Tax=Puccinia graminis f. sp. tritici TaxID=56615 RepID=A0A5B0N3Y1_PUCGR|nr:hypothetical protein PGT21_016278 [Puccinia graminis f. sp. tritici]